MTLSANQSSKTESTDLKTESVNVGRKVRPKQWVTCCPKLHVILDGEAK